MTDIVRVFIFFTIIISLVPIIITLKNREKNNKKILYSILALSISYNAIWYSVLIVELIQSYLPFESNFNSGFAVISVTFIFLIRFIYLFSFLKLFLVLLNIKSTKSIKTMLRISSSFIVVIWLLGLLEFFILKSRIITSNLILYTDILIFFIVILGTIYLIYSSNLLYDLQNQKLIKRLGIIILIPVVLGLLKWLAGDVLTENSIRQQLSIPFLVFLLNIMLSAWLIVYGKKIKDIKIITNSSNSVKKFIKDYNISKRECEVALLISEGATNKEIAEKLFISIDTVKDHNSRIFQKTGVKNRTQLTKLMLS